MSKRFFYFSVLILLLGILSVSCKKEKKKVEVPSEKIMVAKIGEFGVPESRVAKTFEFSKEFQKNKVITPELIKQYINRYYLGEIYLLAEAKAEGLDKDPEFLKIMKAHRIHEMTKQNGPLAKAILSKEYKVNNEELKELYKHLPYRLTLQQILVTSKPLADSLYRLLMNGADFGQLASKYSNDLRSAVKDGVISNYLVAGMASPEYERVAFSLTKEHPISKPIKTEFGYHILKLMAREKQQVGGEKEQGEEHGLQPAGGPGREGGGKPGDQQAQESGPGGQRQAAAHRAPEQKEEEKTEEGRNPTGPAHRVQTQEVRPRHEGRPGKVAEPLHRGPGPRIETKPGPFHPVPGVTEGNEGIVRDEPEPRGEENGKADPHREKKRGSAVLSRPGPCRGVLHGSSSSCVPARARA